MFNLESNDRKCLLLGTSATWRGDRPMSARAKAVVRPKSSQDPRQTWLQLGHIVSQKDSRGTWQTICLSYGGPENQAF
jgi:hypothetical protein